MLSRRYISRWGGLAMVVGGLFWVIKASAILLVEVQPPLIFEVAPLFFALGLLGLYLQLPPSAGRLGLTGVVIASVALVARLAATIYEAMPGARISTGDDFVFPYSLFVLIGTLGIFLSLLLLGMATLRSRGLPPPFHVLPLAVGCFAMLFSATAALHIEVPILLIGCLWLFLGCIIWRSAGSTTPTVAP